MKAVVLTSLFFLFQLGCGVKGKPLAPLKEPWISTGELEKDREKKNKLKRPPPATESRVEFVPPPTPETTETKKE